MHSHILRVNTSRTWKMGMTGSIMFCGNIQTQPERLKKMSLLFLKCQVFFFVFCYAHKKRKMLH